MKKKLKIKGWCAYDTGFVPEIDEISFIKTYRAAKKWENMPYSQTIAKCTIIIEKI